MRWSSSVSCLFFFSSRRRHTRFDCDWSSDVCSSDLMTFLYYPNGCESTCGPADVVFLQNGQVLDAVLRWPGHGYSGQSSSPAATPPHGPARPGGDTLTVKSPSTPGDR